MKIDQYLDKFPHELRAVPAHRRAWTRDDPLLFCLVYLQSSIKFADEQPSLSQFHLDLASYGKSWMKHDGRRDAFIAPRESGKSQWLFKILPIWAAAHGHLKFIAAFSDSASQAEEHLKTFTAELGHNELLKLDYPDLCKPMMSDRASRFVSQSRSQIQQANGFSFSAKGIDAKTLGMKIGNNRPDLILLDDIEPDQSNYSEHEAQKRKHTMLSSVFYLASRANVAIVGTTTMSGSLIDQIRTVGELRAEHQQAQSPVHSADSDYDNVVNSDVLVNATINATTDINYYVRFSKDELTNSDAHKGLSEPLEANETSISQSVTDMDNSRAQSAKALREDVSQRDDLNDMDQSLSSSADNANELDSATESLSLQELATQRSDQALTDELTSDSASETDLKSQISINPMSTTNAHIENFEKVEQQELAKLGLIEPTNRAERNIEQQNYVAETLELDPELQWVDDQRIEVHYYPAIVVDAHGNESSWWPESKSLKELVTQRHTAEFAMNMMNKPVNLDSQYWNSDDIAIAEPASYRFTLISIDPAISTNKTSDFTGISVVSMGSDGLVYVRHAEQLRLVSTALLGHINGLVEQFEASVVVVETNQGGDVWANNVFDGLKAKFVGIRQQERKEVRASRALDYYRRDKIRHTRRFAALEEQMYAFPKVAHDDLVDSVGTGIHCLLSAKPPASKTKRAYT